MVVKEYSKATIPLAPNFQSVSHIAFRVGPETVELTCMQAKQASMDVRVLLTEDPLFILEKRKIDLGFHQAQLIEKCSFTAAELYKGEMGKALAKLSWHC